MNKNILLASTIVLASVLVVSIGSGIESISGNLVDTTVSTNSLILLYLITAAIALGISIITLIHTYSHNSPHSKNKSKNNKNIFSNIKMQIGMHPHSAFNTHIKNTLKAEQIILLAVLAVGMIAVGIILSRI